MRRHCRVLAIISALALPPAFANAQHSHGGSMEMPRRHEHDHEHPSPPSPPPPRGILPDGSPRQIEVLVLSYGFSPASIQAEVGEEVVLLVRRVDESSCPGGLVVPARKLAAELPLGETVPVTLTLERAETIAVRCADSDLQAAIVVAER